MSPTASPPPPPPPPPPTPPPPPAVHCSAPYSQWTDCVAFVPDIPTFDDSRSGIQATFPCRPLSSILDYFTAFFDSV
ncbi:hypothetical protein Pmani_012317 [Petrolisthes manimaculis]|uniref:Uncharacterized protein n=1 Tax=Petrolisthes manimaculis TaxID=1843537 RepID=A0AAE1Q119_9EUCA|nr:hypothetical protein Pmani_012317 [Petrolisthes manimaculis]